MGEIGLFGVLDRLSAWFERANSALRVEYVVILFVAVFISVLASSWVSTESSKKKILIVAAILPPHMDRFGGGKEARIIKNALRESTGVDKVEFLVQPFSRHWSYFLSDERIDAVSTVPMSVRLEGYPSECYITYQNGVGYISEMFPIRFTMDNLVRLSGHRVVAFPGAASIINEVGDLARTFDVYVERRNQQDHSILLAKNKIDAVIADKEIFEFYNKTVMSEETLKKIRFDAVFPPTPYRMVFRSANIRDQFDDAIKKMKKEGSVVCDY